MSRIGKNPISLPQGVTVTYQEAGHSVKVKGSKGELSQKIDPRFKIKIENENITVQPPSMEKKFMPMYGLYRSLIANMVEGVSNGFRRELELVGVGYKATAQGNVLEMSLGYSHSMVMSIPPELKLQATQEKGKNPIITLEGTDKQLIGQIAAKIKSLRPVEPYKGKGIRFVGEYVRRKAGKAAAAK